MARTIFTAALEGVEPQRVLQPHLEKLRELFQHGGFERLLVAGFGKAAITMALAAEEALGGAIEGGLVIAPHGAADGDLLRKIEVAHGAHPHPDRAGLEATQRLMELARQVDETTLLLLLISGGGSALLVAPAAGLSLEDKQQTARLLMEAGADIGELNTVRKHLSAVKGGQLAALAGRAQVVALAISDVAGDRTDVIASGPAVPDPTTFAQAWQIVERLRLTDKVPAAVRERLRHGVEGRLPETPKPGTPLFERMSTVVVASNRDARAAAAAEARRLGLGTAVREDEVSGEARVSGKALAHRALQELAALRAGERICLVSGGETTVQVVGKGTGGRNQELALAFAMEVAGVPGVTLLSAGTDGIDGPTDAAGALVDGDTVKIAREKGLVPEAALAENDAYPFLEKCGALLKTGPTGTNVRDLQIVIVRRG